MPVKKINFNKLTKMVFALLIALSVGLCLAFTSLGADGVALAANDSTGSGAVDVTLSNFAEKLDTGASITLKATAQEKTFAPDPAIATSQATERAVITLSGDLWRAVQSGRITATLLASGTNAYETVSGTAGTKDAGFTVTGAMVGSGKFSTQNTTYTDRIIAPETLLNAENGNEIIIEYYATHTAFDSKTTLGENLSEAKVDCVMNFTLKLSFEEVKVTINSSNGGSVKDSNDNVLDLTAGAKEISLGFGDSISFTALPNDAYYFLGWKNVNTTEANVPGMTLDLGKAVDVPSGESPSYSAQFQYITMAKQDEYIYTGSPVGPVVRSTAYTGVYYLTHSYTGTTISGETINFKSEGLQEIVSAPIRAGSFNYTCEFYYRVGTGEGITKGERIGGVSVDFEVKKNTPIVVRGEDNASTITLNFGDNLSDLDLSYEATNSVDTLVRLSGVLEVYLGEEKISLDKLLPLSNEGTDYTLRFTPSDSNNYNVVDSALKIFVKDSIGGEGTNIEEGNRDYVITKSIATASDVDNGVQNNFASLTLPDGGELIKVSLRATMLDESGQYFFIGWRIGLSRDGSFTANSYDYTYLNSGKVNRDANGDVVSIDGLSYDYYLPHHSKVSAEEKAKYTHAKFQAVFVKDTTCGSASATLTIPYSGSRTYTTPTFSPQRAYYSFGYGQLTYYHASNPETGVEDIPYAIGEHLLKYDIINHAVDDTIVDTRVIAYNVTIGTLVAEIDEYNSIINGGYDRTTGWARQMYYNLSVENLLSKGAEAYYYSSDNGENWTKIEGVIEESSGCKLAFVTPEVVNDTQVRSYIFIATHETNGLPMTFGETTYKVVAGVASHTLVKIDTLVPSLSNVVETSGLNGAWTKLPVSFSALASFGGSGAVIDVCYQNNSSNFVKLDSNISLSDGTDEIKHNDVQVNFSINTQYSGNVKIRIRTGSGLTYEVNTLYPINIDKTAPSFGTPEKNHVASTAQGWIGLTTRVTFEIINEGGSALLNPTGVDDLGNPINVSSVGDGKYMIEISDSRNYRIIAKDEAGNVSEISIQEKIDVQNLTYDFDEESYKAENWAKLGSKVKINVNMGASGARLRCSVDGSDYLPVTEFIGMEVGAVTKNFALEYEIPYSPTTKEYAFRIETGTGAVYDVEFGSVKFDIEDPVYALITDLSAYQGSNWTQNVINAQFTVVDNLGVENSGINADDGVTVDNGGVVTYLGGNVYELVIDKCTEFTLTIKDRAGNTIYAIIQANVDTVTPTLELKAYVGGGNPEDLSEEPTEDENASANLYDFNSWITQANNEPWVRLEFTINLTASGSKLEYSNNNGTTWTALTSTFMPEEGKVTGEEYARAYITTEQNRKYMFRLATGSGKYVLYEHETLEDLYIKLDFTSPTIRSEAFRVGSEANFDLKNVWVNQDGQYRIMLQDTLTGSGVDASSVLLKEYALDVIDEDILNGSAVAVEQVMSRSGDYFVFNMTEAKKYLLCFNDIAGNVYVGEIFVPHIDKTEGFTLSVEATKYNEGGVGTALADNTWLDVNDYVIFEGAPTFTQGTGFGPSGGEMQFSIDNGLTFQSAKTINGESVQVSVNAEGKYQIRVSAEQVYNYKFRLVTGAGVEYVYADSFTVQKDSVDPTISSTLAYQDGGEYDGDWTNKNLRFTINIMVGASGGELYYGKGSSKESATWTHLIDLPKNVAQARAYYYVLDSSTQGNYYFKVVSGRPDITVEDAGEHAVKLDNTPIEVQTKAAKLLTASSVASGSWVESTTNLYPNVTTIGDSDIANVYVKKDEGAGYGEYEVVNTIDYILKINENTSGLVGYVFKVVSVSGMEAETEEFRIGFDNVAPEFNYNVEGSKLPMGNLYEDWYISEVSISVALTKQIVSSYGIYYAYRENEEGADYSEWASVENLFVLNDNAVKGGLDRYYKIKVVSGSGMVVETDELYIPIDTFKYTVKVNQYVGDKASSEDYTYADVLGEGEYNRGSSLMVSVTPHATYTTKAIKELLDSEENSLVDDLAYEESSSQTYSFNYIIGANNVTIDVNFYKEVIVEYGMALVGDVEEDYSVLLRQCLQSGEVQDVPVKAEEEGFDAFFGDFLDIIEKSYKKGDAVFARARDIYELGEYEIIVNSLDENFVIMNTSAELVIVYFENEGTILDPYLVHNEQDFYYVDEYMHYEPSYESVDEMAYLGANRRKAYFKQTGDVILDALFTPNGDKGEGYTNEFMGTYDGNGYEIIYDGTFGARGDFGLFLNVSNGASIINLGARYSIRLDGVENANVGLIVANVTTGGLKNVYAIGNIYVNGSKNVNVGGVVGILTEGSLISFSFADVDISVATVANEKASGNFGGMVGYASKAYTANVYTISRITLNDVDTYDVLASSGTDFAYAGAVLGYIENLDVAGSLPTDANKSYYLDNNISFDGSIERGLSLGNQGTFGQYNLLKHEGANVDFFAGSDGYTGSSVKIIDLDHKTTTVKELVNVRIEKEKEKADMEGNGTTDNPFLIDTQEKLRYIEIFPWAVFKQTADIMLSEGVTFATAVPFVGVYDGDNYSITGAIVDSDVATYGGIFGVVSGTICNLKVIDVSLKYGGENEVYAGGVIGLLEGGTLQNVIVTGTLEVDSNADVVYVGGLVGVMVGGRIENSISMINIVVKGVNVIVGGVVAQAQGGVTIQNVVNLSAMSAHYEKKANVGSSLGAVTNEEAQLINVYHLLQNAYANDKSLASAIGYNASTNVREVVAKTYQGIMETSIALGNVQEVVGALYPFEGAGTKQDPFQIDSYAKLELVGNYMYANFVLTDNVIIGDWNDDGKLDSNDGYDYDFEVIGRGATFTGSLDGDGYSILGLSDSLFAVNAGAVSDLTLNLDYKVYAKASDIPASDKVFDADNGVEYTSSKVAKEGEDIVFGALARVNTATGSLIRVTVTGNIYIRTKGNTKVTLGGFVGIDMGGQIVASQITANVSVRASQMLVGGVVGEITYSDRVLNQITTNYVLINEGINLGGGTIIAGSFIGRIGVETSFEPDYATSTPIIIDGESLGNACYVGLAK